MKTIGIDTNNKFFIYEGSSFWGYPIWPTPTLIPVSIVDESCAVLEPNKDQSNVLKIDYVLIDEGYDPTSRVRKGRLFKNFGEIQPQQWHVQKHPAVPSEEAHVNRNGVIQKSLATFSEFNLTLHLKQESIIRPLFLLGNNEEFTIWSLVDAEATVSGETLVYLKSRKVFGAIPQLNTDVIPSEYLVQVQKQLDILAEDLYRAGSESVIDCCREAVTAILSAYLQQEGYVQPGKDLAQLADAYENAFQKNQIVAGQTKTIARLHSRRKNAEQERRAVRPPTEADGELAVQAVGIILRELGWAID